jgi:hypothetical protein
MQSVRDLRVASPYLKIRAVNGMGDDRIEPFQEIHEKLLHSIR